MEKSIYCPHCGLKNSNNSKLCPDCGENLESGRNYLKIRQFLQYTSVALFLLFVASLLLVGSDINYGDYSTIIMPILFIILIFVLVIIEKLILPRLSGHLRIYCPKCENR